ncbi:hypothetical protein B0T18DRAFT_140226 [Schizothecium vesticola]|uniref:Uncharacterized protein n=1 Tax=Schizothecium vesticola TaxID=314040 RepID=A0AA40EUV2_9PEZI|nr:hypothetical protein B0T18DRAFT_140226 [Schizothecium vesticola]
MSLLKWSPNPTTERRQWALDLWNCLSETLEISIGSACSVITWRFVVQDEAMREGDSMDGQHAEEQRTAGNFLLYPSPGLMLCCCLVFGCCVSSLAHRRQEEDKLQLVVYTVFLSGAVVVGHALEASANLILLGFVPWAMCVAMATSLSGHHLYRSQRLDAGQNLRDEEKARSLK